jgi:hypothetical protein
MLPAAGGVSAPARGGDENGVTRVSDPRFCPNCGQATQPAQRFCANCGAALAPPDAAAEADSGAPPAQVPGPASPPPDKGPRKRRSLAARIALIAVPLVLIAAGVAVALIVSDGSSSGKDDSSSEQSVASERAQAAEERRAAQAKYDTCQDQMGDLLDSLTELDSRLDVGMNYDEYTDSVGDIRVAYDQVPFDEANDPTCLTSVGLPSETALNHYAKATRIWSACFDDFNCSTDSIEPKLRRYWDKASASIDTAKEGLDSMKPDAS